MTKLEKQCAISSILCNATDIQSCPHKCNGQCKLLGECRIEEKTDEQLDYILSPVDKCIYLEACAGSGKTEVLGMKAAYEILRWQSRNTGIAVLTFTNDATDTIANRISTFYRRAIPSNHYIGTFSSFVHGHIAQRFGYMFYRAQPEIEDKSFRVVDADVSHYQNQWLQNYKLDFPLPKGQEIYANQLIYMGGKRDWFMAQGEHSKSMTELYGTAKVQELIASIRKKNNKNYLFQQDYLYQKIKDCKLAFFRAGFANFEDMNLIAVECLRNADICKAVAKKFPVIFIDECQDLSANELCLLSLLMDEGVIVHYIGDLHQSIYSFKDADPEYFVRQITDKSFNKLPLTDNFRSTQSIVDVSRSIAEIKADITGKTENQYDFDCFYVEYASEADSIKKFQVLLDERKISCHKSVVLTRGRPLKEKLSIGASSSLEKYPLICAIQLWSYNTADSCLMALKLLGSQLQKWLGFQGNSRNYYYPETLLDDSVAWRLILRDILTELVSIESISNMDGKTYSSWLTANKKQIVAIINKHLAAVTSETLNLSASFIRAVPKTGELVIGSTDPNDSPALKIETVHAVKGRTFDAVLLISSADSSGKTGYWENWLDPATEASRIAYVACTRPRKLLCWGVHTLTDRQRAKLEHLGFRQYISDTQE